MVIRLSAAWGFGIVWSLAAMLVSAERATAAESPAKPHAESGKLLAEMLDAIVQPTVEEVARAEQAWAALAAHDAVDGRAMYALALVRTHQERYDDAAKLLASPAAHGDAAVLTARLQLWLATQVRLLRAACEGRTAEAAAQVLCAPANFEFLSFEAERERLRKMAK